VGENNSKQVKNLCSLSFKDIDFKSEKLVFKFKNKEDAQTLYEKLKTNGLTREPIKS